MLATLVYSFELFPKAYLILIKHDNASYALAAAKITDGKDNS